jgi:hypothetical protein
MRSSHVLAAFSLAAAGAALADDFLKNDGLVNRVEQRVHAVQPTREERKFDQVGWAPDILIAEKLARSNNRPVFLFTYDGDIGTGRC